MASALLWLALPAAAATQPEAAVPAAASAPATAAKPVPRGLVAMGRLAFAFEADARADNTLAGLRKQADAFDGIVISTPWDHLQPAPGRLDTRTLDADLAEVARYNEGAKKPLWVRLRVFGSHRAPDWAKRLAGGPVQVHQPHAGGRTLQVGKFWHADYRQAWRALMSELAARYDGHPLVRGISITSCTARAAEPFVLPLDSASVGNMQRAGFIDEAYRRCLLEAPQDYAAWKLTPVDYTFNPYHRIEGRKRLDYEVTAEVMRAFRRQFGARAILMNHGLTWPLNERAKPVYAQFKALGPPVSLQMLAPDSSTWDAGILMAVRDLQVDSVEVWPAAGRKFAGYEGLPVGLLHNWSARLRGSGGARE